MNHFLLFACFLLADAQWIVPVPQPSSSKFENDLIWQLGTEQTLVFDTDITELSVVMYQNGNNSFQYLFQNRNYDASNSTKTFLWTVGLIIDASNNVPIASENFLTQGFPSLEEPFFFELFATGATSPAFTSDFFNVTKSATTSSATASSLSVSSSTSLSSTLLNGASSTLLTSTSTSAAAASTSRSDSPSLATSPATTIIASSASSKLSSGADAGIGIGAALGVIALVGLAIFFYRRHKRSSTIEPIHQNIAELPMSNEPPRSSNIVDYYAAAKADPRGMNSNAYEMEGSMGPQTGELHDGESSRHHLSELGEGMEGYSPVSGTDGEESR